MPRPSNREQRRRQIVDATVRVMAGRGFDATSVQAIAREAGLAPGLIHHHFANKAAILDAVLAHLRETLAGRFEDRATRRRSARGRLDAWIDAHLQLDETADPDALACWVWLGAHALRGGPISEAYTALARERFAELCQLVGAAADEAGSRVDAEDVALMVLSAIEGQVQLAATTDLVPAGTAASRVRRLARRLLEPRRGAA
jgi:TetR/AcrR family transcriptional repressor of bet genes